MNAQEKWKREYKRAKYARENYSLLEALDIRANASIYRREAALERRIAALEREVERLNNYINIENVVYDED